MKENIKRAIFFDLDGTLWNALPSLKDAYNIAMEKASMPYRFDLKQIQSYMGLRITTYEFSGTKIFSPPQYPFLSVILLTYE